MALGGTEFVATYNITNVGDIGMARVLVAISLYWPTDRRHDYDSPE